MDPLIVPIGTTLEAAERMLVEKTIESTGGNKKQAAQILGISRSALYAKLERFGRQTAAPDAAKPDAPPAAAAS
jgi:DNA-binding NtrC family response regulator